LLLRGEVLGALTQVTLGLFDLLGRFGVLLEPCLTFLGRHRLELLDGFLEFGMGLGELGEAIPADARGAGFTGLAAATFGAGHGLLDPLGRFRVFFQPRLALLARHRADFLELRLEFRILRG